MNHFNNFLSKHNYMFGPLGYIINEAVSSIRYYLACAYIED